MYPGARTFVSRQPRAQTPVLFLYLYAILALKLDDIAVFRIRHFRQPHEKIYRFVSGHKGGVMPYAGPEHHQRALRDMKRAECCVIGIFRRGADVHDYVPVQRHHRLARVEVIFRLRDD